MGKEVSFVDPDTLVIIGLDEVREDSALNDERAEWDVDEALVRNIMVYGVLQPVLVRPEGGKLYVVDGRQRVKAAREAASRQRAAGEFVAKIPVILKQGEDSRVAGVMVSANEQRREDTVLMKARKATRLLDLCGDKEEVAIAFGRSSKTIENWVRLLTCHPDVLEAVEEGFISSAAAIELSRRDRDDQLTALAELKDMAQQAQEQSQRKKAKPTRAQKEALNKSSTREVKRHPGVKKAWLKKAVKTDSFGDLTADQQDTLNWILTGTVDDPEHWLVPFVAQVDEEIG